MLLLAFGHGLRASELADLRWDQVDLKGSVLRVRRVKRRSPATHLLTGRELRALHRLEREAARACLSASCPLLTKSGHLRAGLILGT
jgi:integrase